MGDRSRLCAKPDIGPKKSNKKPGRFDRVFFALALLNRGGMCSIETCL